MSPSYVALGDSYSAGIGSDSPGTQIRRDGGFPVLLARELGVDLAYQAFLGATTGDVLALQLDPLSEETALVTVTIGGNDAGFAPVLIACAQPAWLSDGLATLRRAMDRAKRDLPGRLDRLYVAIRARAPHAEIVAADYPHLFFGVDCQVLTFFSEAEMAAIDRAADDLGTLLGDAASRHDARFVDIRATFDGHELCRTDPWVHGLTWPVENSFHPVSAGHAAYAEAIAPAARDALGTGRPTLLARATASPAARDSAGPGPRITPGPLRRGSGERFRLPDLLAPHNLDAAARHGLDRAEVADLAGRLPRGQRAVAPSAPAPDPGVIARLRELDAQVRRRTGRP